MRSFRRSEVPEYLQRGNFFKALDPDDDGEFLVPSDCCKYDLTFQSKQELVELLKSHQYWQVNVPNEISSLIYSYKFFDESSESTEWVAWKEIAAVTRCKEASPQNRLVVARKENMSWQFIKWLQKNTHCEFSENACSTAAAAGDLELLMYLREQGCPWNNLTVISAIDNGHLNCFLYARDQNCPLNEEQEPKYYAANAGQIEIMTYLHNHGETWNVHSMREAASGGRVVCLKYLRDQGCPWNATVCRSAAGSGQLECLMFLHENGCPWDASAPGYAIVNNHLPCLKYLVEQKCDLAICQILAAIAWHDKYYDCLRFAHENGCILPQYVAETFDFEKQGELWCFLRLGFGLFIATFVIPCIISIVPFVCYTYIAQRYFHVQPLV